jgi:hypothetical protein
VTLPVEVDDALDALRTAREELGRAVDELHLLRAPVSTLSVFQRAHDATATLVENVSDAIAYYPAAERTEREMLDVEERHVEGQTFPWTELS